MQAPAVPETPADDPPYMGGLTEEQREAVETLDGPLLVLAGAGTGKTRVLTTRVAHIIATGRAWPSQILAVTFTNKAAREMQDRIARMTGGGVEGLWIGTFHAISARILRRHAELVGLRPDFTILDQDDQTRLVKQVLNAESVDTKRWPPRAVGTAIQRFKDRGLPPDRLGAADAGDMADGRLGEIYALYQERLATLNSADFGDLILHCVNLFASSPEVLERWQDRFSHILVDEYQDSNVAQYLWLRLLAQKRRNICCVGDDDQSIYSWRGAEVGNILRFEKDFEGARIVRLERNYRSTQPILAAASEMIAHNRGRLGKTLWTDVADGAPVQVRLVENGEEEARFVCEEIDALQRQGAPLDEIAILVRAGFQMRQFEERMLQADIPYRVYGGPRFYERQEIRDAIAYIRVIEQPDDDLALERIINVPRRGIGDATLQRLHAFARARSISLHEAARRIVGTDELGGARRRLERLLADFARWRKRAVDEDHAEVLKLVLDECGYTEMWQRTTTPDAPGRLENLKELVATLHEFGSFGEFLEHVGLVMDRDGDEGTLKVSLMTLHAAKGLEFAHVFLPGWEEEIFPNHRALADGAEAALEEERRLAYVGLTRAKQRVWISRAVTRLVYNRWVAGAASRFIHELPAKHVNEISRTSRFARAMHAGTDPFSGGRAAGPGRRRAARLQAIPPPAGGAGSVEVGTRIFHQKFGYGTVLANDAGHLDVSFEKAGEKKVMEDFVRPA